MSKSAEQIVYEGLATNPAVSVMVAARIYPDIAAQDADYPFVVYSRSSSEPQWTIHSALIASRVIMSVQCWAKARQAADELADAAITALQVSEALHQGRSAVYDSDSESYGVQLDVAVWE